MLELRHALLDSLQQQLNAQLTPTALQWWHQAQQQIREQPDTTTVALACSQCRRLLGEQTFSCSVSNAAWNQAELGRVLLVAQALQLQASAQQAPLLRRLYQWGDDQEKAGLLKALDWLDTEGFHVELAVQAGRANSRLVFSAIALDNPYPARHYNERAFYQLVLKSLFMDLDVRRIQGLEQRRSVELNQLALDLLQERLAAGRAEPATLAFAVDSSVLSPAQTELLRSLMQQQQLHSNWQ